MTERVISNVMGSPLCMSKFFDSLLKRTGTNYPDYIKVAVDWWADAVLSPRFDSGNEAVSLFLTVMNVKKKKTFSERDICRFKKVLAKQITKEMEKNNRCYLRVDYFPNHPLSVAAKKVRLDRKTGFPCKTAMEIYEDKVLVSAGYQAEYETLWTK